MADTKKKQADIKNPLEIASELGKDFADKGIDLLTGVAQTATEQIGLTPRKTAPMTEISLGKQAQTLEMRAQKAEEKVAKLEQKFHSDIMRNSQEVYNFQKQQEMQKIQQLVQNLAVEVKNIQNQAAALSGDVKNVTVEQVPTPDKYHLNFFEWVLIMLRDIKKDIVKSRTWLHAFNSKKKKKGYWAMFKKHGTSFAMSDERGIATAAG